MSIAPVEIANLAEYESVKVRDINDRGDIAGQATRASNEPTAQAVIWHRRAKGFEAEVLPPLDGLVRGDARGFATDEQPVGYSYDLSGHRSAVLWTTDESGQVVPSELEPPPGFTTAIAYSGNGKGAVAGEAGNPGELVDGVANRHAVVWIVTRDGQTTVCDLGTPDGYLTSSANDVNGPGIVAGTATRRGDDGRLLTDVVVWRPRASRRGDACRYEAVPLPSDPDLPANQSPAINAAGDVVARADGGSPMAANALFWRPAGRGYRDPEHLPTPEGFVDAYARSLNARGDVVGTAQQRDRPGGSIVATALVVWTAGPRGWTAFLPPAPEGMTRLMGEAINDAGEIAADSLLTVAGSSGAYLWAPQSTRDRRGGRWHVCPHCHHRVLWYHRCAAHAFGWGVPGRR